MELPKKKSKTVYMTLSIIFSLIALFLLAICFSLALHIFLHLDEYRDPNNNSAIGISFAAAIVLYIIFGAADIFSTVIGTIFSSLGVKKKSKLCLISLIVNILNFVALIAFFVIINIVI